MGLPGGVDSGSLEGCPLRGSMIGGRVRSPEGGPLRGLDWVVP
jgi:hypothetical protein